jgi:predicted metalloprotease
MRWTPGETSGNIEDRRSQGFGGGGGARLGIGGFLLLLLLSFIFRRDLISPFIGAGGGSSVTTSRPDPARDAAEATTVKFVSFVLDDAQATWKKTLAAQGVRYPDATLVLFRDATPSACGMGQSAMGPFYCPGDQKVYIDLGFYDELQRRFGAPGEFARAYVLAHELGHHVQNILGIDQKVRALQQRNPSLRNALSVRMELQADCLAGIWGHSTAERNILESKDVDDGLRAAAAIGDDTIQRKSAGRVVPESFTHGTSAQRAYWLRQGLDTGQLASCDTFSSDR